MAKKRLVIALGHDALGTNLPEQKEAVARTAKIIGDFIQDSWQVAVVHSNAPQLSMIHTAMNEFGRHHEGYTPAPMSVCSAMSQGYIGYDIQNSLRTELLRRGIYKTVSTILTQVTVDPYDEAFHQPSKIIGRVLNKEEAEAEEAKGNYVTPVEGGWRRIVAAPKPRDIIELDAIQLMLDAGQIVIAGGGGGIPVLEQGEVLKGASAVIEKDLLSGLLAEELHADELMILTSVEHVSLSYQSGEATPLGRLTVAEAEQYMEQGQFEKGTMLPKIEASVSFLKKGGKRAVITSIDKAREGYLGRTGTIIE